MLVLSISRSHSSKVWLQKVIFFVTSGWCYFFIPSPTLLPGSDNIPLILRRISKPGGATPTLQRNAAYFCLSFARLSLAWLFALGRVLTWLDLTPSETQLNQHERRPNKFFPPHPTTILALKIYQKLSSNDIGLVELESKPVDHRYIPIGPVAPGGALLRQKSCQRCSRSGTSTRTSKKREREREVRFFRA
jgi:hypothetical protein